MTKTIKALFDGEVLRPEGAVNLKPNVHYRIIVTQELHKSGVGSAWDILKELDGVVKAPRDWSAEHDHYLYGTPKRHEGTDS